MANVVAMDLFEAYAKKQLPMDHGYIVSSFFKEDSTYSIYEIISYSTVKDIYVSGNGLVFQTNGKKMFLMVEPPNYVKKAVEPVFRDKDYQVPLRFNTSNIYKAKDRSTVMFSKEAQGAISAFTVLKPTGIDFALLFYKTDKSFNAIENFFQQTLNREANVPLSDSKKVAAQFAALCQEQLVWADE